MKQLEVREPLTYRHMMEADLLFVGQRVGVSIVSLQIKPWNKQSIMGHQPRQQNESDGVLLHCYLRIRSRGSRQVPNYRKFLKGAGNKASLANYISLYILEHATEYIPNGKSIILAGGFSEGTLVKEAAPSGVSSIERLYSNQEEADTRMILHASSLSRDHERIIIQCDDTDVLALLVYYFSRGHLTDHVYMYAGHS